MATTDVKDLFESIKESLSTKNLSTSSAYKNILRLEQGNSYLVRFIPNIKEPKNTFFHYMLHGFKSKATGQYIDATCPRTFGERCPICELRLKLYATQKEEDKNLAYAIRPQEKHMINAYVISDPVHPENDGTIKVLRYSKKMHEKILAATEGDDADDFGTRIYDLSENGCNFKIKVDSVTDSKSRATFLNYDNSRFTNASAIPNMDKEKMKEVYDGIFDLSKMIEIKSIDEINDIITTHILCKDSTVSMPLNTSKTANTEVEMTYTPPMAATETTKPADDSNSQKIQDMLKALEG